MKQHRLLQQKPGAIFFTLANYALLTLAALLVLYPVYYCVMLSFNDGNDAARGGIYFWPRVFTVENYRYVLTDPNIAHAAFITVARTVLGTLAALLVTSMYSYALTREDMLFRRFYKTLGVLTMYMVPGLIPCILLIRGLGLYDQFIVYIVVYLFAMFYAILFLSFFKEIPAALAESARIDGAGDLTIFFRIIAPVSKPVFATVGLFLGINQWNYWFDTMIYTKSPDLETLAHLLTVMLNSSRATEVLAAGKQMGVAVISGGVTSTAVMLASMVVTAFPIMVVYPLLQGYFVKGATLGSIKG